MKEISLWKEAFDSLQSSVAIIVPDGTIAAVNHSWATKTFEYGHNPLWDEPGANFIEYLDSLAANGSNNAQQFLEQFGSMLLGNNDSYATEFHIHSPQGVRWFLAEITPIFLNTGTVGGIVLVYTDITCYKEKEAHLEHSLSQISLAGELLPICAVCKSIKDENNKWNSPEAYLKKQTRAEFTHDICPKCIRVLYPKYSAILDHSEGCE
ncbi:PAS domain-containing protein [Paenibacillus puldeungensis]|uniref:PAS domain-containing protein n=1 Tax=Paenibacillus puldeungensis TaxID=696536 RepID=A0ABW3RST0_9BACL